MSVELRQAECYSNIEYVGLTKREQIAAMVLQGLLAGRSDDRCVMYADAAVMLADALLAELEK
jgi:hypothetical protein